MAAASTALRPALVGPVRRGRVLAVLPGAVHIQIVDGGMLALLSPRAARLPIGVVLPAASWPAPGALGSGVTPEAESWIGDGGVQVAGLAWRVARWWDPRVPLLRRPAMGVSALAGRLPRLPAEVAEPTDRLASALHATAEFDDDADGLGAAERRGGGLDAAVAGLVGLGPGLTPAGDDVLAGALVALAAFGARRLQAALAGQVQRRMAATTMLSAALLARACAGESVPELTGLLRACAGPDLQRVAGAVTALGRVGHTSGTALGHGALTAIRAAAAARAEAA